MDTIKLKIQITQSSLFQTLNNHRRKILESNYLDFLLTSLIARLESYPPALIIDTTNHCNARCAWCHNPNLRYSKGVMSQELFEKIIDDYCHYGGKVWFGTFGEPFMDKNILNKVRYVRKIDSIKDVTLLTNGLLLNSDKSSQLLDLKVNIEISLDEIDKMKFETVKQIDFDKVINNVMFLLEENNKSGCPVKIVIRMKTIQSEKEIEESNLYKRLKELSSFIDLTPIASSDSIANWAGNFNKSKFFDKFYPETILNGRYKNYNLQNNAPCSQLWKNMVVMWDGKVVLCCADMEGQVVIGDLNQGSIVDVWKGEKIETVRELFKNRLKSKIPLCKKCDLHQGWQYLRKNFNSKGGLYKNNFLK